MKKSNNHLAVIHHFLFVFLALMMLATSCATTGREPQKYSGATPLMWSQRLAASQMARHHGAPKGDYTVGLLSLSLLKLNEVVPNPSYVTFAEDAVGSLVATNGTIQGYKVEEYQLDALNPGKTLLALWQITNEERYIKAAMLLRGQLNSQPRTPDGGFWHKQRYTQQMW